MIKLNKFNDIWYVRINLGSNWLTRWIAKILIRTFSDQYYKQIGSDRFGVSLKVGPAKLEKI